jgi:transcriptional regulator of acetoin/glycerol metabolism
MKAISQLLIIALSFTIVASVNSHAQDTAGKDILEALKQKYIVEAKWSIGQLAKAMNLDRTTLSKWLKKHGLAETKH